jgi:acyl-CoA synthetase (AMP-forming)/AMP-acid ligase II
MAVIDALGHVTLTDPVKDVIKSGGEWISSLQLEDVALSLRPKGKAWLRPTNEKIVVVQSRDHSTACDLEFVISAE